MEVTKLSSDKSEILVQLYDSLEDVLEKGNELDKKILEQMDAFNKVEKELSDLDKRFDSLKSNNVDNLTTNGAKDAGDIVREIISKKKEKQNLLDVDQVLYKEYMIITNEIKRIQGDIDNVLSEEEIETLSTNSGMKVNSLDSVVHIKHTDLGYIVLQPISIENSEISETTMNIVGEISRKFKLNEEETKESNNPHEMLINLYNSRNRLKEENEEFLNRVPKFIKKEDTQNEKSINKNVEQKEENSNLTGVINKIDNYKLNEQTGKEEKIDINAYDDDNVIMNQDIDSTNTELEDVNDENQNIVNINTDVEEINNNSEELTEDDSKVNLQVDSNIEQNVGTIDENLEQSVKEPINLNVLNENVVPNLNTEQAPEENKIVGMPNLDLPTENLTPVQNIEPPIPEIKVPTFEVPAPNIPVSTKSEVNINNNVPLNEDEVNSILAGNNIAEPSSKEDVSEVIINELSEPAKIANSTEAKVQTILGVWSKYKVPKTVIKNDIKKNENVVPLNAILSGSDNSQNTTTNNIQSFFSNAA